MQLVQAVAFLLGGTGLGPSQKSPSPSPPPSSFFFKYQPVTIPCSGASALRLGEVGGSRGPCGAQGSEPRRADVVQAYI